MEEIASHLRRGTRGLVPTNGLEEKLAQSAKTGKPLTIKLGLDPTAPDIHLGSAVVLRKLRQFQDFGHNVVIIIGDFTAMIGDPSGRNETRPQLTEEKIKANAATYANQYHKILDERKTQIRFNSEWLGKLSFADVIRLASHATLARTLERDDFTKRYKEGLSIGLHELLYPLCQAYDSVVLKADIEMGGTDQMFNILAGRDLQREYGQEPQVSLFMPILTGLDGVHKMSKSLGNTVGITEPPNDMYGKLMSISDVLLPEYLELCTDIPVDEIERMVKGMKEDRLNPKDVKRKLASEVVTIYYGHEAAAAADAEFERVHSAHQIPNQMPEVEIPSDGKPTIWICRLLVDTGLAKGTGEARRLVEQGGVTINGERVDRADAELPLGQISGAVLRAGKNRFLRIKLSSSR
ncbi:MAG: tyrosine--tRNA ligase [Armatimonadetes bacterium]|nr:tyrosine--tRNA ligase [Armatimonadota bacterium]